jgi:hypothetical protein
MNDRRRCDEAIGRVAVKTVKLTSTDCDFARER